MNYVVGCVASLALVVGVASAQTPSVSAQSNSYTTARTLTPPEATVMCVVGKYNAWSFGQSSRPAPGIQSEKMKAIQSECRLQYHLTDEEFSALKMPLPSELSETTPVKTELAAPRSTGAAKVFAGLLVIAVCLGIAVPVPKYIADANLKRSPWLAAQALLLKTLLLVCVFFGFLLLVGDFRQKDSSVAEMKSWDQVDGDVVSSRVVEERSGGKTYYKPKIWVNYIFRGIPLSSELRAAPTQGNRLEFMADDLVTEYPKGRHLKVSVNPEDIKKIRSSTYSLGAGDYLDMFLTSVILTCFVCLLRFPARVMFGKKSASQASPDGAHP